MMGRVERDGRGRRKAGRTVEWAAGSWRSDRGHVVAGDAETKWQRSVDN